MASVTFPPELGGNNTTVTDDGSTTTGLANGGHRTRFVPALSQTVQMASAAKDWAGSTTGLVYGIDYSSRAWAISDIVPSGSSKNWAVKTGALVDTLDYSSKEWAIGTFVPSGSAARWATLINTTVNGVDYSAKEYAVGTTVPVGSAMRWAVGSGIVAGGLSSAKTYADQAFQSALTAVNAPGTSATSTTSNTIPTTFPASLTYTIQTGKAFAVGQFVIAASSASPQNYVVGQITAHNSTTGSLTISVASAAQTGGSGTFTSWSIALTALANVAGAATIGGNNTFSGVNTFTNATSPIVTSLIGPATTQQHALPAVASDTFTLVNATQTLANKTLTSPVISGATQFSLTGAGSTLSVSPNTTGSINNVNIGATTPGTGSFTNLSANGNVALGDAGTDTTTINSQLSANGSVGTTGQFLTSRGTNTSPQWTTGFIAGSPVQSAYSETNAQTALTTIIPADNTIPQSNEGQLFLQASITPTSATNILEIEAIVYGSEGTNVAQAIIAALFQNTGVDAIASASISTNAANNQHTGFITIRRRVTAGATTSQTFTVRVGVDSNPTAVQVMNTSVQGSTQFTLGGTFYSSLRITEIRT